MGVGDKVGLAVVVLRHMFSPDDIKRGASILDELRKDIFEECSVHGVVKTITLYERHPDGVVCIRFKSPVSAESCIKAMDGRWYGGRRVKAGYWDGVTDFKVKDSEEEEKRRIEAFGEWLESEA